MNETLTVVLLFFFFFQAEDGIRDKLVTGVQTCALPIYGKVDRAVLPLDLAVDDLLAPLPELCVVGDAPLERDVRVLDEPRQLARRVGLVALAVVHGILGGIETGALAEPGASDAVNLHQKAVGPVRVLAISDWHGSTSSMAIRVGPAR